MEDSNFCNFFCFHDFRNRVARESLRRAFGTGRNIKIPAGDLGYAIRALRSDPVGQFLFDFAIPWRDQDGLSWLKFFDQIPQHIRDSIANFSNRHFHLLNFLARCGPAALDIVVANPPIGYLLANLWVFRQPPPQRPLRSARSLLHKKQRAILEYFGIPPTETNRKILRKLSQPFGIPSLMYLRTALRDSDARQVCKLLAHVPRINRTVIRLTTDPLLRRFTSATLLNDICNDPESDRRPVAAWLLRDVLQTCEANNNCLRIPKIRSYNHLREIHHRVVTENYRLNQAEIGNLSFPPPPFQGNAAISPLTDGDQLRAWATAQKNCIASLAMAMGVIRGNRYFYSMRFRIASSVERCTLSVEKNGDEWFLARIAGTCNRAPSPQATRAAQEWFLEATRAEK